MKKFSPAYILIGSSALAVALIGLLSLSLVSYDVQAAPIRPPRPTPVPTAQLGIRNTVEMVKPSVLTKGEPMTYTFMINNASNSRLDARDSVFELPFSGDQQLISFSTDKPGWKLREGVTSGVYVDLGTVAIGEGGTITVVATFATNYDKSIFRQTVYLTWNDEFQSRRVGLNITLPVNLPARDPITAPIITPRPVPPTPVGPFGPAPDPGKAISDDGWYFYATKHSLHGAFLNYWLSHGAVITLGYPISEEFNDNGMTVQYFERVVMEFWPQNPPEYQVLLRSLGRELGEVEDPISAGTSSASPNSVFYPETGHWLDGRFVATWEDLGGLAQFGFPISEPVIENDRLIQWTERARFELDLSRPNQLVMLGLVGNESARLKGFIN